MARPDPPEFLKRTGQKYTEPPDIDLTKPSIARVYSYFLGGKDHFEADREMANYAEGVVPGVTDLALGNRAFVQRAARYLATEAGIEQYLDIGSGLPTDGNVHEVVHESTPHGRVVYVDKDPMVLAHARALLADNNTTIVLKADLTAPKAVLQEAVATGLIDPDRPVALMLGGILHHLQDEEDPGGITRELCDALAPGSHLVISHFCRPDAVRSPKSAKRAEALQKAFMEKLGHGLWRTREEILSYFQGWPLVEPGLVPLNDWRPLPKESAQAGNYVMPPRNKHIIIGAIAKKP
ncbi:SAM-dependent methyltransferase [Nocardiopsis sp. RSe5-2]|uniref:SAM-dependent methyltransferase n=1 Tax=Nocardiopsis endophytica TaxID=3018445 RepID=A0ABT4UBI9_9ACTN|nr:SAM-dependent methyltransferase [Nocardiopsis endophytica]MDA2814353.1 SAM-dependent methyltransferase [Nocardiopsis endophytica]